MHLQNNWFFYVLIIVVFAIIIHWDNSRKMRALFKEFASHLEEQEAPEMTRKLLSFAEKVMLLNSQTKWQYFVCTLLILYLFFYNR